MCDPLTLGALAVGAAGTAANTIGQASAQKKQESEYNRWAETQKKNRAAENVRQEGLRGQAETARQQGLADISAENQSKLQQDEAARQAAMLNEETGPTSTTAPPQAIADAALSGSEYGGDVFKTDLTRGLADAAASAKARIGALGAVQSFGGGFGGLGTVNPINQAKAGGGIDAANEMRKGSLGAYATEQAVDPTEMTYSNPIADVASSFLGAGMGGLGSMAAGGAGLGAGMGAGTGTGISSIFKNTFKKLPSSAGLSAKSPWTGLF
jgi:hypothetical protein